MVIRSSLPAQRPLLALMSIWASSVHYAPQQVPDPFTQCCSKSCWWPQTEPLSYGGLSNCVMKRAASHWRGNSLYTSMDFIFHGNLLPAMINGARCEIFIIQRVMLHTITPWYNSCTLSLNDLKYQKDLQVLRFASCLAIYLILRSQLQLVF